MSYGIDLVWSPITKLALGINTLSRLHDTDCCKVPPQFGSAPGDGGVSKAGGNWGHQIGYSVCQGRWQFGGCMCRRRLTSGLLTESTLCPWPVQGVPADPFINSQHCRLSFILRGQPRRS